MLCVVVLKSCMVYHMLGKEYILDDITFITLSKTSDLL